jgi:hypothetical protein
VTTIKIELGTAIQPSINAPPGQHQGGKIVKYLYAAVFTVLAATSATAETPKSYFCEISNVYELGDAGVLQSSGHSREKGERFQINIKTGEMTGGLFSSSHWARTSVLDSGTSPRGSFLKVIYASPPGEFVNTGYLQIHGTIEQPSRPFLYVYSGSLYSGVCSAAF